MKGWDWEGFWGYFTNLYLLEGALVTVGLTLSTLLFGGIIGMLLAVMRLSKHKALSRAAQTYIWIFRGTPLLVQLIIIYTGLPQLGGIRFSVVESAMLGLALNEGAYLSEILRGGILSVAKGQTEAARALGLRPYQIFRQIVLPQALRVIIPPLGNSVNGLLKTTSIASVISMEEVLRRGQILMQQKFQVLEIFMVVAIIYLVMTTCWDYIQRRIEAYYGKAYGAIETKQLARDDH
jgi:polar amino acid transport system permease protein